MSQTNSTIELFITLSKYPDLEKKIRKLQGLPVGYEPSPEVFSDKKHYFKTSDGKSIEIERILTAEDAYAYSLLEMALLNDESEQISPHLSIYKFGINMLGSILHRITGVVGIFCVFVLILLLPIIMYGSSILWIYNVLQTFLSFIIHILVYGFVIMFVSHTLLSIYKYLFEKYNDILGLFVILDILKITFIINILFIILFTILFF